MVYFTEIRPSEHYLEHHSDVPWHKVVDVIFKTKNPRKKGDKFEIENGLNVLFEIKDIICDKRKMNCPKCRARLKEVNVKVQGARQKSLSYQCPKCDYFEFEKESSAKVIAELSPLKIKQKVVKLSGERLGMYLNSNVVRSLKIKKGDEIYISVPDKKHIMIELS